MKAPEPVQQLAGGLGLFALTLAIGWLSHGPALWAAVAGSLGGFAAWFAHESGQHGLGGMWKPRLDSVRLAGVAIGGGVCAWLG